MRRLKSYLNLLKRQARRQPKAKKVKTIQTISFRKNRVYGIVAVIVLLLLALLVGYYTARFFTTGFSTIIDTKTISPRINTNINYAIFVLEKDTDPSRKFLVDCYLVSISKQEETVYVIKVSPEFYYFQPMLGKSLPLKATYNNASAMGANPFHALNSALSNFLSLGINGYIVVDAEVTKEIPPLLGFGAIPEKIIDLQKATFVNQLALLVNLKEFDNRVLTTMNRQEILSLVADFVDYRLVKVIDMGTSYGLLANFPTGKGLDPDYNLIDLQIAEVLRSNQVLAEQIKVEVFNATNTPGLAFRTAKKLTNYGVNVVRYSNAPRPEEISILYVPINATAKLNIEIIKSLVKPDIRILNTPYEYNSTGDVVLVLGNDILN